MEEKNVRMKYYVLLLLLLSYKFTICQNKFDSALVKEVLVSKFNVFTTTKSMDTVLFSWLRGIDPFPCLAEKNALIDPSENPKPGLCDKKIVFYAVGLLDKNLRVLMYKTGYGATGLTNSCFIYKICNDKIARFLFMDISVKVINIKIFKQFLRNENYNIMGL